MTSFNKFVPTVLTTCLSLLPMQNCLGRVNNTDHQKAKVMQVQSANRLTHLDLSRITFNDDISYLSVAEQKQYTNVRRSFSNPLNTCPKKNKKS